MLSGLRKDMEMPYRGLMMVCVLTFGLVLATSASAMAQDTKPAPAPAEPTVGPAPVEKAPGAAPAGTQTPGAPAARTSTTGPAAGSSKTQSPSPGPDMWLILVLMGGVVLMLMWSGRGRRKQEAKHKEMLANLKKGDKIVTIGGIIGTVIEVKPDEVTVKVDETNNVRMKFTRRAIAAVGDGAKTASPDEDKK
jgi:preprotein translocase subunit YajC